MRTLLHILTRPEDDLTRELITRQRALPQTQVQVVDWTVNDPDYATALEILFAADSVQVW